MVSDEILQNSNIQLDIYNVKVLGVTRLILLSAERKESAISQKSSPEQYSKLSTI